MTDQLPHKLKWRDGEIMAYVTTSTLSHGIQLLIHELFSALA